MSEALRVVLDYGFGTLKFERIEAYGCLRMLILKGSLRD